MSLKSLSRDSLVVAPSILGAVLTVHSDQGSVAVRITEVEAYEGQRDPASHAYKGESPRNEVMFGPAGHLYVYRSHGLHWCCNVVCGVTGTATAVLLRAGQVIDGIDLAHERRGENVKDDNLARGPGNLGRTIGITSEHNGADLLKGTSVVLTVGKPVDPAQCVAGPRVGVSKAADWPWRFHLAGDPTVSAYRRSPRAPATPSSESTGPER